MDKVSNNKIDKRALGQHFKEVREARNLAQEYVAQKAGFKKRQNLMDIESGKAISLESFLRLAWFYGLCDVSKVLKIAKLKLK